MHDKIANMKNDHPVPVGFVGGEREYRDVLAPFVDRGDVELRDYPNGRNVLRRAEEWNAMWLIDLELPDMSGFDLFEMIRDRLQDAIVCMIGPEYCQADEVRAYRAGATIYASRPLETAWMQRCVELLLGDRKSSGVGGVKATAGSSINPNEVPPQTGMLVEKNSTQVKQLLHAKKPSSAESSQKRRTNDDSIPIRFCRSDDYGRVAADNHADRIRSPDSRAL